MSCNDSEEWKKAEETEINNMLSHNVWEVIPLSLTTTPSHPPGRIRRSLDPIIRSSNTKCAFALRVFAKHTA
jgi:hypothetical protein